MSLRRYNRTLRINGGRTYGTSTSATAIRTGVEDGDIAVRRMTCKENERLDIIAGKTYGNASLWWIIAAASGVGWAPQVPAGTILFIPINLSDISRIVG